MASFAQQMNNLWMKHYPPGGNTSANAGSDPHITGFSNQRYQCRPKKDTLYFRNLSAEFEMHGRHEGPRSKLKSQIRISAIAIRVRSQRIEYNMQGRNFMDPNNNGFLIDGEAIQLTDKGLFLTESETSIILENAYMFHVYTAAGIKVTVYNCSGSNLTVTLTLPRIIAQKAEPSLFGNLTGGHGQIISASGIFSNSLEDHERLSPEEIINSTIQHGIKIRVRPTGMILMMQVTSGTLIGELIKNACQASGLNQPADHYYMTHYEKELKVYYTVEESGLLNTKEYTDENCPEVRLKFLHLLDESSHLAANIILTTSEELVYKDLLELPHSPTQQDIMPEILGPLIKKLNQKKSKSPEISSKLVSMPVFTKQVINDLPSLNVNLSLKPDEFDSDEFLAHLAIDLGVDRNDIFLISVQEGSTKYKIKLKAAISLNPEKMKQISARMNMIALPSSKSGEFLAQQKLSGNIQGIPKIEVNLENVDGNPNVSNSKTLSYDEIDNILLLMERPEIIDTPVWEFLTQKSRKISTGILHAFQTSGTEYIIETMSLIHNEELYHKYSQCSVGGEEKILFHGTKLHNIDSIFEKNFKTFYNGSSNVQITDAGWYGQGTYFSSSPRYCASYAGSAINVLYLICSLVKLGQVYHVKDMSYHGKPMRHDSDTHYVKVTSSGHPTAEEHSFDEEFVIKSSAQILPLYIIGLRQVHRFVLWRDAKISNSENGYLFAQMKDKYSFNIYGSQTTSEALTILKCKLADASMNCVVVTNGADNGKEFVQACRNIRSTIPIVVFCANVAYHQQWASAIAMSGQPPVQVTGDSNSVFSYIHHNFPS